MDSVDRRDFIRTFAAATTADRVVEGSQATPHGPQSAPVFLSTWRHGKAANDRAAEVFQIGRAHV